MSTLEDRLHAALTAKSDGVAFSMLTRSLPTQEGDPSLDAPVVLLPAPPHRPGRSWRSSATAVAVAAILLIAVVAVGLYRASGPDTVNPAHIGNRSDIPWHMVGKGWILELESSRTAAPVDTGAFSRRVDAPELFLVDPRGQKYQIASLDTGTWWLDDWDHQHERALLVVQDSGKSFGSEQTELLQLDLRTGAEQRLPAPDRVSARYSGPDGRSIILEYGTELIGYGLTGQQTWRINVPQPPFVNAGYVITPDAIITSGTAGLNVYDATSGRLTGNLPAPDGFGPCASPQWLDDGTLTAVCAPTHARSSTDYRPFVFAAAGVPAAGRTDPEFPAGWNRVTAFRQGAVAMDGLLPHLNGASLARIDSAGRVTRMEVPQQFIPDWRILGSTAEEFIVVQDHRDDHDTFDRLARWNPFTGKITPIALTPTLPGGILNAMIW
jgi:hypothetical protein